MIHAKRLAVGLAMMGSVIALPVLALLWPEILWLYGAIVVALLAYFVGWDIMR